MFVFSIEFTVGNSNTPSDTYEIAPVVQMDQYTILCSLAKFQ